MKVRELREHLAKIDQEYDELEVKVWLPGSTVRLSPMTLTPHRGFIILEGNLDPGSVLVQGYRP